GMLTIEGCRGRQERFLARLEEAGVPAALISHPRDIYYFTGVLPEGVVYAYPSLLFLGPGLKSWLVTGLADGEAAVDEKLVYPINELYTMNPDNHRRLSEVVSGPAGRTPNLARLGFQGEALSHSVASAVEAAAPPREWAAIDSIVLDLQLRKDPDEVACIRRAVSATLAGYTRAQQVLQPGVSELEVMTECQMAAQRHSRQVHFFNGDFQAGAFGGFARDRKIEKGELYIIDAWSDLGGYWCDMARTWSVGGEPTDLQASVYAHVAEVLTAVPSMARVGRSTIEMWAELDERLREHPHLAETGLITHGGHGIGLRAHEGPDLNRDRGGVFEVGNVFTCEPGGYSDELRRGIRLENLFHVTNNGVELLSPYPLSVVPDPLCPLP
ncbi:MAG TPA: Xaa-Pro peptidase family protein, partial [Armatimonadota bacterium]|nr:Xaa-Pro peptidase family protein [Armatimonadota bacterium]